MDKMKDAFYQVYVGEAKAALRLKLYAQKAETEGYPQIAKLFRAISFSEEIHGIRALRMLGAVKGTEENLTASFESETTVAEVKYKEFLQMALAEGKNNQAKIFSQARDVEETHAALYKKTMEHMLEDRDVDYHVCLVCGYVADGDVPDKCPVCDAPKEQFNQLY
ncbi:MAG: rubrerythrin family protein [bacterium]|nr:rubrerythrin family protein [bacterium]